jgi:hypothetical protein
MTVTASTTFRIGEELEVTLTLTDDEFARLDGAGSAAAKSAAR